MAKSKAQQNALLIDPNREKITKNMPVIPGSPGNGDVNTPFTVEQSMQTQPVQAQSIYGDYQQQYAQMGTGMVNPSIPRSQLPQNMPMGQKMNAMAPYGMQPQPDSRMSDQMESMRLAQTAQLEGLPAGAMGLQGMGPVGEFPPAMPNTMGQPLMQGLPSAEMAAGNSSMIPGSSPTKINKKGKRTA